MFAEIFTEYFQNPEKLENLPEIGFFPIFLISTANFKKKKQKSIYA